MDFGKWLRRQIEETGETQEAFAQKVGVSLTALRIWMENRCPQILGRNRSRLARALGLSRDAIDERMAQAAEVGATATAA